MTCPNATLVQTTGLASRNILRAALAPIAEHGLLRDLVQTLGGDACGMCETERRVPVTLWRACQDVTLLHEGASAKSLYVLRSGSMKTLRTLADGYEQVLSFAQPGELLGFEALSSGRQPASVVALEETMVYALPLHGLHDLRQQCAALDAALQLALSRQLVRAAETAEIMAAVASDVRLARFLVWMSNRMVELGHSPQRLLLRMGRRDIASMLGVAHETVSRSFTALSEAGYLKVENREVEILNLAQLQVRACCTRRPVDAPEQSGSGKAHRTPAILSTTWFPQTETA